MPSQKSMSGTKFTSFTVKTKKKDTQQALKVTTKTLSKESGIPEDILKNVLAKFGREDELDTVYKELLDNKTIMDNTHVIAILSFKKGLSELPKMREENEFQSLPIPEIRKENMKDLKILQFLYPNSDFVYFPNLGLYHMDYLVDALNIFYDSGMKDIEFLVGSNKLSRINVDKKDVKEYKEEGYKLVKEEGRNIIMEKKLKVGFPLPLVIKSGDYEIYIAPRIFSEDDEAYEEYTIEGKGYIPSEKLIGFLTQDLTELKEKRRQYQRLQKIWKYYSYKKYYRAINKIIRDATLPDTIAELQEYKRDVKDILAHQLKDLLAEYSIDMEKLMGGRTRRRVSKDLSGLMEIYQELVESEKKKDKRKLEILEHMKKAHTKIIDHLASIDKKRTDIQSNLMNINSDIDERIRTIWNWYGDEFLADLKKKIPEYQSEYLERFNIWFPPTEKNKKILETLLRDYYSISQLAEIRKEKKSEERDHIYKILSHDKSIVSKIDYRLRRLGFSLNRASRYETITRLENQVSNLEVVRRNVVDSIKKKLRKEGYTPKKGTTETYVKMLSVGEVEHTI